MKRVALLAGKAHCAICNCQITTLQANLHQTCDHWKCRQKHRAQQRVLKQQRLERERLQQEELRERVRVYRDEVAGLLGIDEPESFAPMVVPANQSPLTNLPGKRRGDFRDHLVALISEAAKQLRAAPHGPKGVSPLGGQVPCPPNGRSAGTINHGSEMLPIFRSACATCGGGCCALGGNHAYLNAQTIRRYMEEHPSQPAGYVLGAFLSRLSERTYRDSCIYHGENGCGLPPEMRSASCTSFECTEFARLRSECSDGGPRRAFLAAVDGNKIVRSAFVHEDNHVDKVLKLKTGVAKMGTGSERD